jgi:chitinase
MRLRYGVLVAVICAAWLVWSLATVASPSAQAASPIPVGQAAPYEHLGWGDPQRPTRVMAVTGIRQFTLAFILSDGTCTPKWDGRRPLAGGPDQAAINRIREAGGDAVVSFGGWSGRKLGVRCRSPWALARAYQEVVDVYNLKAIDIDIEHTEMASATVRRRVVAALKIVLGHVRGLRVYVTLGTTENGPDADGRDLIERAAAAGLSVDGWVIMPFDFGRPVANMGKISIHAAEGLRRDLMATYHESAAAAYRTMGISSINGRTDEPDETVTVGDFKTMRAYAQDHHLARFTFWSVNRDRPCHSWSTPDTCSGIPQAPFAFTKIIAQYHG